MFKKIPCIRVDGETFTSGQHEVIEEVTPCPFVNGRHAMTAMMSPVQFEEFVTGDLFTEQIIKGVDEIESIKIDKNRMSVITKNLFKVLGPKKTILSGLRGQYPDISIPRSLPKITSDYCIGPQEIWQSAKAVLNSELHMTTGGIHIVALLDHGKALAVSEDIGRHNALDRVIGHRPPEGYRSLAQLRDRLREDLIGDGPQVSYREYPRYCLAGCNHHPCRGDRGEDRAFRGRFCPGRETEHLLAPGTDRRIRVWFRIFPECVFQLAERQTPRYRGRRTPGEPRRVRQQWPLCSFFRSFLCSP